MDRQPIAEIGVCTLVIIICAVLWRQASYLPPGSFEPLGSGPVPQVTAAIVILCCLWIILRAVLQMRGGAGVFAEIRKETHGRSPYGAIVMLGASVTYVSVLHLRLLPFGIATFIFLALLIWSLENFRRRALLPAALTAALVGFGTEFLFTNVFVVDLPT